MNDFDDFIKNYFGVIVRPQTYLNMLYLFLSFPLGIFYFVFLVTGLSLGFPLIILWVGILILAAVFAASWGLTAFERGLAISILHVRIPPMARPTQPSAGFWQRIREYLTNPVTWKGMLYLFCRFPLGIINFTLAVTFLAIILGCVAAPFTYSIATYDFGFMVVNSLSDALLVMILGLVLAPAGLHLLNFVTRIQGEFARVMLGQASFEENSPAAPAASQTVDQPAAPENGPTQS
ncbi:putative sensor [Longilinea arvoryzae]|uniref:Putative sensor n=1 Tax=Longilinea arvoryzae TaxID=360412 RepID=A0A0S7BKD4_9CHLR|nr:sensor domain-containing protein [Longilinea arvoryzae]GAP14808.1 putative sensor [Longilinea arvoryzae]